MVPSMIFDRRRLCPAFGVGLGCLLISIGAIAQEGAKGAQPTRNTLAAPDREIKRAHSTMGTLVQIITYTDQEAQAVRAIDEAFGEFDRLDKLMTTWTPDSEVSRINTAAGTKPGVPISADTLAVLQKAAWGARVTHGAFDITVGAFKGLWKFDQDKDGSLPTPTSVKEQRRLVNWRDVLVDPRAQTARLRRDGQAITLGGIAKGYATDRAVAILRQHGLVDFIVQAGGDMFVSGKKGERRWVVGVRDPRSEWRGEFFAFVEVEDRTFSTSGDYERFVLADGKRYHHILDPKTGYPAVLSRSVTVMAKDALTADVLSTGLFILGHERGMKIVQSLPDVEAVLVDDKHQVHVAQGLTQRIKIAHEPTDGI